MSQIITRPRPNAAQKGSSPTCGLRSKELTLISWPSVPLCRQLQYRNNVNPKMAACIFCKIIKGERIYILPLFMLTESMLLGDIPSFKLFESEKVLAFLDIQPLSRGHAVCPSNLCSAASSYTILMTEARHPQIPRREVSRNSG